MKSYAIALAAAVACLSFISDPTKAYADPLECPVLADLDTSPLEATIEPLVSKGLSLELPNQLQSAILLLRTHGMSSDDTINHLIAFYCPAVSAETGLTDEQKVERVQQFALDATRQVFASEGVEDVIYNVPLPPDIAQAATIQADSAGLTVEHWIARQVENALD